MSAFLLVCAAGASQRPSSNCWKGVDLAAGFCREYFLKKESRASEEARLFRQGVQPLVYGGGAGDFTPDIIHRLHGLNESGNLFGR